MFGSSSIEYVTDRPVSAIDCGLPDGSRGTVICAIQKEDGLEPQWLRPRTDLLASARIADLVKDLRFATDLYRAMCNTDWSRNDMGWATTWRVAGEIVAHLRDLNESYNDFYCSGDEGVVADDVAAELAALGWTEAPYKHP
jgi:hypothetical protein